MLSSKPIVQAIDEPGSMVEKVNCGLRVEAENPQAAAEAIIKLSDKTNQERATMGERGKEYAINNLQWSILAKKFLDSLE